MVVPGGVEPPLAKPVWFPTHFLLFWNKKNGGTGWGRTTDLGLMSPTL